MKQRSRIPVVAVLTLMSTATLWAQSPLITNPANLAQFPTVERIKTATKGTDDVDSHARFMVALWRINGMMVRDLLMAPNAGMYTLPAAAAPIQEQYRRALSRYSIDEAPPAIRDPRYRPLEAKYEADPAFLDFLLVQLFSPKFRTEYYAWVRKPVPPLTATAAAAGKAASPDPSIAKAKAAKVDLTLFAGSITLGNQFSFPNCPPMEISIFSAGPPADITTACDSTDRKLSVPLPGMEDLLNGLESGGKSDPNTRSIELPASSIPRWVAGSTVWVRLDQGGRIAAVIFMTKGLTAQKSVSDELMAKYGKAHYSEGGTFKTDGGREFKYEDRYWSLPGIHVGYDALVSDEDKRSSVDGPGQVRVEIETEYSRRKAEENKPKKRVL